MRVTEIQDNELIHQTTDRLMKLRNTKWTWTALMCLAFGLLLDLPDIAHSIATHDSDYPDTCVAFVIIAVAWIVGMIQFASLRKQARTLAGSAKPRVELVDIQPARR
jgi:hypothetical protein